MFKEMVYKAQHSMRKALFIAGPVLEQISESTEEVLLWRQNSIRTASGH